MAKVDEIIGASVVYIRLLSIDGDTGTIQFQIGEEQTGYKKIFLVRLNDEVHIKIADNAFLAGVLLQRTNPDIWEQSQSSGSLEKPESEKIPPQDLS